MHVLNLSRKESCYISTKSRLWSTLFRCISLATDFFPLIHFYLNHTNYLDDKRFSIFCMYKYFSLGYWKQGLTIIMLMMAIEPETCLWLSFDLQTINFYLFKGMSTLANSWVLRLSPLVLRSCSWLHPFEVKIILINRWIYVTYVFDKPVFIYVIQIHATDHSVISLFLFILLR